ncbi:unnamed protein product, partial [Brassica rapa subsp. trilocularis]
TVNLLRLPCSSLPPHKRLCHKLPLLRRKSSASVSGHRTFSVVFLCRRRHARIQASPLCSSSRPLSHYKRYQSNNGDFLYFATQAPNLWIFSN